MYFIIIGTQNRFHLFGEIVNGKMVLTDAGTMIQQIWHEIPKYYAGFDIHEFIVMPNHIHGIIQITVGAGPCACPNTGQPNKGQPRGVAPTKRYIDGVKQKHWQRFNGKLWQRNYWEHIIRNENEYNRIAQYIIDNPTKWALDKLNGGMGNMVMESAGSFNEKIWMA